MGGRVHLARQALMDAHLPAMAFELPLDARLDPKALFPQARHAIGLEIGFGGGEHLIDQARRHEDWGWIGVEPFRRGVGKLVAGCLEAELSNVRILIDDARRLLVALPDASIAAVHVHYPDPWPKARHKKRRIVNGWTMRQIARVLQAGGELRLSTDITDYARAMLEAGLGEPGLLWMAERAADWLERPHDQIETRYEHKARAAGRGSTYLRFVRAPLAQITD